MAELVKVVDITIGERYRKDLGDIDALVASIQNVGLISPIAVNADNVLIAGQRRLEAVKRLGWDVVEVVIVDGSQPLASEHDENVVRKDFTPSERKAITDALLVMERPRAAERKRVAPHAARQREMSGATAPVVGQRQLEGRASHIAAQAAGWSRDSYRRFSDIQAAFEADPDNPEVRAVYEAVEKGEMGIKGGQRRLVLVGALEANSTEFDGETSPKHMGLQKRSSKTQTARLHKMSNAIAGYAIAFESMQPEEGDAFRQVLEELLKDVNTVRREIRRLLQRG